MKATKLVSLLLGFVLAFAVGAQPAAADETTGAGAFIMTLETDKSVYQLGEDVDILFRLDNSSECTIDVDLNFSPGWDVLAYENPNNLSRLELLGTQDPIWWAIRNVAWVCWTWHIPPGQVHQYQVIWDQTTFEGSEVGPGEYEVVGALCGYVTSTPYGAEIDRTNAQKHITIVPEPGTIVLLLCSAVPLIVRRTKRLTGCK